MIGRPWDQLSTEEKIEILRQQIAELFWRSHTNVIIANQEVDKIWKRIEALEKRQDQNGTEGAGRQPDDS
jgi:hypothetical protein